MAKPSPSGLPQNLFLSSAILKYDGVDFGLVSGVKLTNKELTTEGKSDQFGKAIINHFYVGQEIGLELEMDQYTVLNMKKVFPNAKLITGVSSYKLAFGDGIGQQYYSLAKPLEILASSDDTSDYSHYYKLWKAVPIPEATVEMGPEKQVRIKFKFMVYPDVTQPVGMLYGFMGDPAAGTLVAASAGPAVAGGSNVGNGTVGSFVVSDTYTVTETWTATCIAAVVNGGIFSVVGSVTGSRGNATVGSAYKSNSITPANSEIGFTIADGSTDFAVGDTFTIPTVAANYV